MCSVVQLNDSQNCLWPVTRNSPAQLRGIESGSNRAHCDDFYQERRWNRLSLKHGRVSVWGTDKRIHSATRRRTLQTASNCYHDKLIVKLVYQQQYCVRERERVRERIRLLWIGRRRRRSNLSYGDNVERAGLQRRTNSCQMGGVNRPVEAEIVFFTPPSEVRQSTGLGERNCRSFHRLAINGWTGLRCCYWIHEVQSLDLH